MSSDTDDTSLLTRIVARDEGAMETFYRRHSPAVMHFTMKTVANPADTAEVVNEVMMEVWRNAGNFSQRSSVRTWLLGIARHKAIDLLRRRSRHDDVGELEEALQVAPQCSLEQAYGGARDAERVRQCLAQLKDGHRQVVYLTFYEGLSYSDIAAVLDIPSGTVKTRMLHAKQKLLACLGRQGAGMH